MQAVCVAFRRVRFEALQVRRKCAGSTPSTFRARPFVLALTERGFTYRSAAVFPAATPAATSRATSFDLIISLSLHIPDLPQ